MKFFLYHLNEPKFSSGYFKYTVNIPRIIPLKAGFSNVFLCASKYGSLFVSQSVRQQVQLKYHAGIILMKFHNILLDAVEGKRTFLNNNTIELHCKWAPRTQVAFDLRHEDRGKRLLNDYKQHRVYEMLE